VTLASEFEATGRCRGQLALRFWTAHIDLHMIPALALARIQANCAATGLLAD
jgi:hypothetical protein